MLKINKAKAVHDFFLAGIIFKGIEGILEFIAGISLLFIKSGLIINLVQRIFYHELLEDPKDFIATHLTQASQHITIGAMAFASAYLLIHALINIILFLALWHKKSWAYPLAGAVLSLFSAYQLIRFFRTHSVMLLFLTIVDIVIIILLRSEYKRSKPAHD